jgi:hypothetical protein
MFSRWHRIALRSYNTPVRVIKSANQAHEWLEVSCQSEQDMYQLLHMNPQLRIAFDRAIDMIPELKTIKDEMNLYMSKQGYMSKENPLVIDQTKQQQIMQDTKLMHLRNLMHKSLTKHGFLVPADADDQEPPNLFGPAGQQATVVYGSVPPRRSGMQTMLKLDYDRMLMEDKGVLERIRYRFRTFFNKWMY